MTFRVTGFCSILLFLTSLYAETQTAFFPLEKIKPGLTGVGKTVFQGTQVETFQVTILGLLENIGPKQNLILARLSGNKLDDYGVFAGISGSPVYIDDQLVGAVAFSFQFATEPIAGITPIQEMVDIFQKRTATSFKLGISRMTRHAV